MAAVHLTTRGSGYPVLLVHGFPFDKSIWDDFVPRIEKSFRVILTDLPGLGESEPLTVPFTIDQVAATVIEALKEEGIRDCALVGHSLGGYVVLAMAALEPKMFSRLVLFHSTAHADSQEKKANRDKVIDFVKGSGAAAFTSSFINPLFADPKHPQVGKVREIAMRASADAVTGYTQAMRDRPDRTAVLTRFRKPILIVAGEKDPGIPVESIRSQASLSPEIQVHLLANVGHMGMYENPDESALTIVNFLKQSNQP
jgi:pimeloyl-ACP methyl ester carboxylesterase